MADGQDRKERLEKLRREREAKVKELDDKITNKESSMRKGLQARQGLDQVVCSLFCMLVLLFHFSGIPIESLTELISELDIDLLQRLHVSAPIVNLGSQSNDD